MASITRYNNPFDETFDDLLKGFFVRPMTFDNQATPAQMRLDVKETDKDYIVRAEIPGVKKDDINITIDGNQVSITAEVKREQDEKQGEKVLRTERYFGKVYRAFSLAQDVDEAGAEAKYVDGVLDLRLPKKAATHAKRLTIQ